MGGMRVHENVIDMQKASFWEADIDESGLHPRQNFCYTSAIDITNETMIGMALMNSSVTIRCSSNAIRV